MQQHSCSETERKRSKQKLAKANHFLFFFGKITLAAVVAMSMSPAEVIYGQLYKVKVRHQSCPVVSVSVSVLGCPGHTAQLAQHDHTHTQSETNFEQPKQPFQSILKSKGRRRTPERVKVVTWVISAVRTLLPATAAAADGQMLITMEVCSRPQMHKCSNVVTRVFNCLITFFNFNFSFSWWQSQSIKSLSAELRVRVWARAIWQC